MPQVQDQSLRLLTGSPACYHCVISNSSNYCDTTTIYSFFPEREKYAFLLLHPTADIKSFPHSYSGEICTCHSKTYPLLRTLPFTVLSVNGLHEKRYSFYCAGKYLSHMVHPGMHKKDRVRGSFVHHSSFDHIFVCVQCNGCNSDTDNTITVNISQHHCKQ